MSSSMYGCISLSLIILFSVCCHAQQIDPRQEIYYVCIGSSDYVSVTPSVNIDRGINGFGGLRCANPSATLMAELLRRTGKGRGILLTSRPKSFVTRDDMIRALDSLLQMVERVKKRKPLVVFYFAGHGVSEGVAWNQFCIPGDMMFTGDIAAGSVDTMSAYAIHLSYVVDKLGESGCPFLVLMDNCRSATEERFQYQVLQPKASESLLDIAKALRFMNEFRGGDPVIFAATPGDSVLEAADPRDPIETLAPLCRRTYLLVEKFRKRRKPISLADYVNNLVDPAFDDQTKAGVTYAENVSSTAVWQPPFTQSEYGPIDLVGSGTDASPSIMFLDKGSTADSHLDLSQPISGNVELIRNSSAGDWVGDGIDDTLTISAKYVKVTQSGIAELEFIVFDGKEDWTFSFSAPKDSVLRLGAFQKAVRSGFQEWDQAGIDVSASGRGCNKIEGHFTISELATSSNGSLVSFSIEFYQSCDDHPPLHGRLRFSRVQ